MQYADPAGACKTVIFNLTRKGASFVITIQCCQSWRFCGKVAHLSYFFWRISIAPFIKKRQNVAHFEVTPRFGAFLTQPVGNTGDNARNDSELIRIDFLTRRSPFLRQIKLSEL